MSDIIVSERRKEERIPLNGNAMYVDIVLSCPKGHKITKPIVDISASGLAFSMDSDEGFFLPGNKIENIIVRDSKYEKKIASAVVRYCAPVREADKTCYKMGLEFIIKPFEKSALKRKLLRSYRIRQPRFDASLFSTLNWSLHFYHCGQNVTSERVLNFSKNGIAFCVGKSSVEFKNGDTLDGVIVFVNNEILYKGSVKIARIEDKDGDIILRCSFQDSWIDLNKVFLISKEKEIEQKLSFPLGQANELKIIDKDFKCEVNDLRDFLLNLKSILDNEEETLKNNLISREDRIFYEKHILNTVANLSLETINKSFAKISELTKQLPPDTDSIYKTYFRNILHNLLLLSPFNYRCFTKPLGYAGDYEMMNMIYENITEGETLFAKLINRQILSGTAPTAVRSRSKYMSEKITDLLKNHFDSKQSINITNIACGPCWEIQELIRNCNEINKCHFTLVDADEEPLLYSQDVLHNLKRSYNRITTFSFYHKSIDQLLKERELKNNIEKQDIIYSTGLFDYLDANASALLVKCFYELLNDNGYLFICNFNHNNDTRNFMEYVGEWYITHRSDEEVMSFAKKIREPRHVSLDKDQTGVCTFLVVRK